jgi:very-short-patch-repair endonuclease
MVEAARQFRKAPTPSEAVLWQALRDRQLDGIKFRRQQPIGPFVVDFFAPALRLVVEVDGPIHAAQQEADRQRQELLEMAGLRVFRLTAEEVEHNLPQALTNLRNFIKNLPSPFMGEGERSEATPVSLYWKSVGGEGKQGELWQREWKGAQGLAEDVRYYGLWMRAEAEKRIGHLYPKYRLTADLLAERPDLRLQGLKEGDELTVIAWLWARTVKCPNPACGAQMPLARSFALSTKKGKQAWVEPQVERFSHPPRITFTVKTGSGSVPEGTVMRTGARCIACGTPVALDHIRSEGKAGRMSAQLMAIVAEGKSGRIYLPPLPEHAAIAEKAQPAWKPEQELLSLIHI